METGYARIMLKGSTCTDPVDSLARLTLQALAKQAKIPPRERFNRLVKIGLIDRQGNLDMRHVHVTTLGELARQSRKVPLKAINGNSKRRSQKS